MNKLTGKYNTINKKIELNIDGNVIDDPSRVAIAFNTYFIDSIKTLTHNSPGLNHSIAPLNTNAPILTFREVTKSKVCMIISSLNCSRAKDVYGMDTIFIKTHKEALIPPITKIINQSIIDGVFPSAWKTAAITPVYKPGDNMTISNYRPISILPSVSKIAEKWISEQITFHLNATSFTLHPMQFGFRKHHSTETANCFLLENIKSKLDQGGVVGAVFLDLKKAFETVDHEFLKNNVIKV